LRRVIYGQLRKLYLARYGVNFEGDDAAADDLELVLYAISLGPDPAQRMRNFIEGYAAWALPDAEGFIARILNMPVWERKLTPEQLGQRTGVTNAEREALALTLILPVDRTPEQLAEQRKAKRLERDRIRKRAKRTGMSRAEYLASLTQSLSKRRPWEAEGISRAKWYRRRETRLSPDKHYLGADNPVSRLALSQGGRASSKKPLSVSGLSPSKLTSGKALTIEVCEPKRTTLSQ